METIPVSPASLACAVDVLHAGGVVIHPTETCYGIACDLTNEDAVKDLFDVKKRPLDQPVSALFSSVDAARVFVDVSPKAEALIARHLPGPLTLVLPRKKDAPPLWLTAAGNGQDEWIGVRISSHPFAMDLATAFGKPVATTSANLHGKSNPYSVQDIESQWADSAPLPELVIDGGILPVAPPSTVIRVTGEEMQVLRQGELKIAE